MSAGKLGVEVPGLGTQAVTVGATRYNPGRAIVADCTAAGAATFVFQDGSTIVVNLQANQVYVFPWAIIGVSVSAGTATFHIIY